MAGGVHRAEPCPQADELAVAAPSVGAGKGDVFPTFLVAGEEFRHFRRRGRLTRELVHAQALQY